MKWFDARRGFGFIGRDGAVDVFVHGGDVEAPQALAPGDRVRFEVAEGPRGLLARRVRLASDPR